MRARRGNYTLLFIVTSGVLFFFMALSIDVGRLQAARVSVENAAEAASIAALMEIRQGRNRAQATQVAQGTADFVASRGLAGGASTPNIILDIEWGEFLWERPRDNAWRQTPNGRQAITIEARTGGGGLPTLFLPAARLLTGGDAGANGGRIEVAANARAAMRNRDVVVAFDVSRMSGFDDEVMRTALGQMLNAIDAQNVPGDRLALVAYAGDSWIYDLTDPGGLIGTSSGVSTVAQTITAAEPPLDAALFNAEIVFPQAQQVVGRIRPCFMGAEVFHRLHRFFRPGAFDDFEVAGTSLQYGFMGRDAFGNAVPTVAWDEPNFQSARQYAQAGTFAMDDVDEATWESLRVSPPTAPGSGLDIFAQCDVWNASFLHWLLQDPRVRDDVQIGPDNSRSPLSCHAGSDGLLPANSYNAFTDTNDVVAVPPQVAGPPLESCIPGVDFVDHTTGERFVPWTADDESAPGPIEPWDVRDRGFAWAGSNPGAGLERAADILESRPDPSREPVVILVAGNGPVCGPNLAAVASRNPCSAPFFNQFAAARERLNQLDAHFYIVGNVDPGIDAAAQSNLLFASSTLGRGFYAPVEEPSAVAGALLDFVSDLQVQVVR